MPLAAMLPAPSGKRIGSIPGCGALEARGRSEDGGFTGRVHKACEFVRSRPACLTAECWATADGEAVVTTGRFESEEALKAAIAAAHATRA